METCWSEAVTRFSAPTRRAPRSPAGLQQSADLVTRDELLELCAGLPGAVEDFPFGDGVAVFKVGGRMFALVPIGGSCSVNLKCDPGMALELRARHPSVRPGYHQDKRHWNTVQLDGTIDDDDLREMVDHSYQLVVAKLPRVVRDRIRSS